MPTRMFRAELILWFITLIHKITTMFTDHRMVWEKSNCGIRFLHIYKCLLFFSRHSFFVVEYHQGDLQLASVVRTPAHLHLWTKAHRCVIADVLPRATQPCLLKGLRLLSHTVMSKYQWFHNNNVSIVSTRN